MWVQSLGWKDSLEEGMATHVNNYLTKIQNVSKLKTYIYVCVYVCVCVYICMYVHISEKAMAPHSSTLAWKTPWTKEPGGLQSVGSLGVGHD